MERFEKANRQGTVALGYVTLEGERWSYREVDVDEETERAMNLVANKHGGDWDYEMLEASLNSFSEAFDLDDPSDMGLLGFDLAEVSMILGTSRRPDDRDAVEIDPGISDQIDTSICPKCGHEYPT